MVKANLTFYGATGSVTGANFSLGFPDKNYSFLVDCGLEQGSEEAEERNTLPFPYDPGTQNALLVTHAHIDHIGRIPKLVRDGFKGDIYSTNETKALAAIMFEDAFAIMRYESGKENKPLLYEKEDIEEALRLWKTHDYYERFELLEGVFVEFRDAGHILGSALIEVTLEDEKIVFTGDLGNSNSLLLRPTDALQNAKYVVMESVYGDREHEKGEERRALLEEIIKTTAGRGGTLLIPAFSLERTQTMLHELNHLVEEGKVPQIPVYLDSPLAIRVTELYRNMQKNFGKEILKEKESDPHLFDFPGLVMTKTREESEAINKVKGPKIIIAGSGMSHAGRIRYHEARYLSDPASAILLIGYQAPGSLGRKLQEGVKKVKVFEKEVKVKAEIKTLLSYSAHMDSPQLLEFISANKGADTVFVVMGEPKSSTFLAQRMRDFLGIHAVVPSSGETFELVFGEK